MLVKLGVNIDRLERSIRRALNIIDAVNKELEHEEAVVTSTYEGDHSPSSLHYAHLAVDIRLGMNKQQTVKALRRALGRKFDVVLEKDHIHIEYDIG
jgi:hypothetical protein